MGKRKYKYTKKPAIASNINILELYEQNNTNEEIELKLKIGIQKIKLVINKYKTLSNYLESGTEKYLFSDFKKAVIGAKSWKQVSKELDVSIPSHLISWKLLCEKLNISFEHFEIYSPKKITNKEKYIEYLSALGVRGTGPNIIPNLVRLKILEHKCCECGIGTVYNNKPITLQLDHISGDHCDNSIENLRILCPNCHTQTPTYGGKGYKLGIRRINNKKECKVCGEKISSSAQRCSECVHKSLERANWPSDEDLAKLVWEFPRTKLADKLGVTNVAVARRCTRRGIAQPARGYWAKKKASQQS